MNLDSKVFVVTGAGGGIGGELVHALLAKGSEVAAVDLRQDLLDALCAGCSVDKGTLSKHQVDIADKDSVYDLPKKIVKTHGKIDGVINCAGIIQPFVKINDLEYETIEKVMAVNFYGTVNMTKAFLPHLIERPEAYIVNFSSMGGFLPVPGQGVYSASKAAVKLFTEALYAELVETSVHVSVVFPGATDTKITENSGVKVPGGAKGGSKNSKIQMLSAKKVAEIVVRSIETNKPQIFTGKDSRLMNKLYRLSPVLAIKLIAKRMKTLLS